MGVGRREERFIGIYRPWLLDLNLADLNLQHRKPLSPSLRRFCPHFLPTRPCMPSRPDPTELRSHHIRSHSFFSFVAGQSLSTAILRLQSGTQSFGKAETP